MAYDIGFTQHAGEGGRVKMELHSRLVTRQTKILYLDFSFNQDTNAHAPNCTVLENVNTSFNEDSMLLLNYAIP